VFKTMTATKRMFLILFILSVGGVGVAVAVLGGGPRTGRSAVTKDVWTGEAKTPFVEVAVVEPKSARAEHDDGKVESKPVRANGASFLAVMEREMRVPAVGSSWPLGLDILPGIAGLRVRNRADKPLTFYNVARFRVTRADGTPLRTGGGADKVRPAQPVTVAPGKEVLLPILTFLQWDADGKTLRLNGQDGTGWSWWFEDIKPGRYFWTAEYEIKASPDQAKPVWLGKVAMKPVAFEVLDWRAGLKESKAVRGNGADFQAVTEPALGAPPPGGRRTVTVGLAVTNRGEKTLLFSLFDTIRPALKSADGQAVELIPLPRKGTSALLPIRVGPGETGAVWFRPRLEWQPGGKMLRLTAQDGTGGGWRFDGLVPGKYLLRFEYENTEAALNRFLSFRPVHVEEGQAFWTGKVATDDVGFEIVAPKD
jgi:hypothetical protein